jgi:hypothetical protein
MKKEKETKSVWNVKASRFPKNGTMGRKIKFLLNYAILAPSGHNSQPWKFVIKKNVLEILPDYKRERKIVDPNYRELFISLGATAKNVEISANNFGMRFEKTIREKGIFFKFENGQWVETDKDMFEVITKRMTNRGEYEIKSPDKEVVRKLVDIKTKNTWIKTVENKTEKLKLAQLIYEADLVWFKSKELTNELEGWLRDDIEMAKDGLPTGVLNLYKMAVEVKYLFAKDSTTALDKAKKDWNQAIDAPILLAIGTKEDNIINWIEAGEVYETIALKLTRMGLSNSFYNVVLELKGFRRKLTEMWKIKGKLQMLIRIGYAKENIGHSPRRTVDEVLL